jgi:hypothetical protein
VENLQAVTVRLASHHLVKAKDGAALLAKDVDLRLGGVRDDRDEIAVYVLRGHQGRGQVLGGGGGLGGGGPGGGGPGGGGGLGGGAKVFAGSVLKAGGCTKLNAVDP